MKKTVVFGVTLAIVVALGWLNKPATTVHNQPNLTPLNSDNIPTTTDSSNKSKVEKAELVNAKGKQISEQPKQNSIDSEHAVLITTTLFENIYNKQPIDFAAEKALLNYLKETNDDQVYQQIISWLHNLKFGEENQDRLMAYGLSLLAAIDTREAAEIFFSVMQQDNWQGSSAIYSVKSSVARLTQNDSYKDLVQQTFTQVNDSNPFLKELALAIAYHAKEPQLDYLINYVGGEQNNKSNVAIQAMKNIQTEALVPHLVRYISDTKSLKVKNTALDSLAHMGQYEAASALITWSASQPQTSNDQVQTLFDIAIRRSPSTKRAIEKEIDSHTFLSESIKQLIIEMAKIN